MFQIQLHFDLACRVAVICCMVDGSVVALDTEGSVVWKVEQH